MIGLGVLTQIPSSTSIINRLDAGNQTTYEGNTSYSVLDQNCTGTDRVSGGWSNGSLICSSLVAEATNVSGNASFAHNASAVSCTDIFGSADDFCVDSNTGGGENATNASFSWNASYTPCTGVFGTADNVCEDDDTTCSADGSCADITYDSELDYFTVQDAIDAGVFLNSFNTTTQLNNSNATWALNASWCSAADFGDIVNAPTKFGNDTEEIQDALGSSYNVLGNNGSVTYNDASDQWDLLFWVDTFSFNNLLDAPTKFGNDTEEIIQTGIMYWVNQTNLTSQIPQNSTNASNSSWCSAMDYGDVVNAPSAVSDLEFDAGNCSADTSCDDVTYDSELDYFSVQDAIDALFYQNAFNETGQGLNWSKSIININFSNSPACSENNFLRGFDGDGEAICEADAEGGGGGGDATTTLGSTNITGNTAPYCLVDEECSISDFVYNVSYTPYNTSGCVITILNNVSAALVSSAPMNASWQGLHNYTYTPATIGANRAWMHCGWGDDIGNQTVSVVVRP